MAQSNDSKIRSDIKEMYSYYFHRIDLEKRGICVYNRNDPDERDHWAFLTILLLDDPSEFGERFIRKLNG